MDGCMDGEVLINGIIVGWSVGRPKRLVTDLVRAPGLDFHSLFFKTLFRKAFFSSFCDLGWRGLESSFFGCWVVSLLCCCVVGLCGCNED